MKKNFASDNYAGIHPNILTAIQTANTGPSIAYGNDDYTKQAVTKFKEKFGEKIEVFFVFNGTAANVLSLSAVLRSYQAVVCVESAHIQVDECGAPEKFAGCKLFLVPSKDGKLKIEFVDRFLSRVGDQHQVQPKLISISQCTEYGTVYSADEIAKIADFAHENNMYLHIDGARIANAAASLNVNLKSLIVDTGVDILSFGGTKNGMMVGEAVIFLNTELAKDFLYIRKQSMQLASKMRFISAQFIALLSNDLWLQNAKHANAMATLLANQLIKIPALTITQQVAANAIFVKIPREKINALQEKFSFYLWNETTSEVRLMTSFDTTEDDVNEFVTTTKLLFN